ncbi:DNA helicase, partial [Haematococcus lacustris]
MLKLYYYGIDKVRAHVHGYNSTQQTSIATALSHRLALIHGPPGTGKTTTTAGLVSFIKKGLTKRLNSPVLVCGQSNTAVDKLVEDLVAIGLKVVRLGNPTRVSPQALQVTLFEHTKRHPRYKELQDLIKQAASLLAKVAKAKQRLDGRARGGKRRKAREGIWSDKREVQAAIDDLKDRIRLDIISESGVVCCTCIGAGGPELEGFNFPLLVLDEGSQASEPEAL